MTLKEAGELYESQRKKISDVNQHIVLLTDVLRDDGPLGRPVRCEVRYDILMAIAEELRDYLEHLEHVMDKEITT